MAPAPSFSDAAANVASVVFTQLPDRIATFGLVSTIKAFITTESILNAALRFCRCFFVDAMGHDLFSVSLSYILNIVIRGAKVNLL